MAGRGTNLVVLVLASALALGAGETALRLLLPAPPMVDLGSTQGADVSVAPSPDSAEKVGDLYLQTDKGLRLRPNASLRISHYPLGGRTVEISADGLGMRRIRRPAESGGPTTRVLFLGDSVTFGEGVSDDEVFVQLLEGRRLADGSRLVNFNGGVPGYGLINALELLEDVGPAVNADRIILVVYLNDAIPSPSIRVLTPPGPLADSYLVSQVYVAVSRAAGLLAPRNRFMPDRELVEAWQLEVLADKSDPSRALAAKNLSDWGVSWSDGVWDYLSPMLERFAATTERLGATPLVVVTPLRQQLDSTVLDDRPQRAIKDIGQRLGLPVIDLLPDLREAAVREDEDLFLDHCHFTPQGHRVVATVLGAILERLPAAPPEAPAAPAS